MSVDQKGGILQRSYLGDYSRSGELPISERLKIGSTASDVLEEIVALHPEIQAVSLIFYDSQLTSSDCVFSENMSAWLPRAAVSRDNLKQISDVNFKASNNTLMMAVGSQVLLHEAREFAYIPMIDFAPDADDLSETISKVSSIPGALLSGGTSYHYWGFALLSRDSWLKSVEFRLQAEKKRKRNQKQLYGSGFLESSLRTTPPALRMFGYPNSDKGNEPKVVALVR